MNKQQLEAIRARDADDYAAADVLRNIRSAGNTDPELEATINMIADRRDLLAAYDALTTLLRAARQDLVVWEAAHGMKGETTTPALIASIDAAIGTASQPTAREDADHG